MALGTGLCAGKIIAGVLGVGAASVLGFNWMATGCPSGVCPIERAAQGQITTASMTNAVIPASLTAVAAESAIDSCCQLLAVAEEAETKACETKACETVACETATTGAVAGKADSCCSEMMADQAAVTSVALTTEATDASEPCCFDKGAKAACDEAKACCQENFGMADTSVAKP